MSRQNLKCRATFPKCRATFWKCRRQFSDARARRGFSEIVRIGTLVKTPEDGVAMPPCRIISAVASVVFIIFKFEVPKRAFKFY